MHTDHEIDIPAHPPEVAGNLPIECPKEQRSSDARRRAGALDRNAVDVPGACPFQEGHCSHVVAEIL
jgi:hypothetical protein